MRAVIEMVDSYADRYSVSGDSEHVYVNDETGQIVATCETAEEARATARALEAEALLREARPYLRGGVGALELLDLGERIDAYLVGDTETP